MARENVPRINIFDNTFDNLQRAMDITTKKQAILSHNIANIDTPGFKPLDFDEVLGKAVRRAEGRPLVLEEELAALSENSIRYSAYVKLISSKINVMRTIATQGRR